ncbi:helix-turn-helix transcriptional regulator [Echinimonas agarilytica]|uniref:AraC family transcriptional regulator n=1 Tax=Echinimonas agarilytica TaxID=1215918 RepID=A0AA41W410_9GAMM|nr:helix-turn-helix domain-containing protein [Echinimonas agarilytica]MCM2678198.1 AraC family transcriptional regulator [Echinimonas agarilytica]
MSQPYVSRNDKVMRPIIAELLYSLLQQRSSNPEAYLAGTRLFANQFSQHDQFISQSQLDKFIEQALHCGDADLPFLLGQHLILSDDTLAKLLRYCPTIKQATQHISTFYSRWNLPIQLRVLRTHSHVHLDIISESAQANLANFYLKFATSAVSFWLRNYCAEVQWQLSYHHAIASVHSYIGSNATFDRQFCRASINMHSVSQPHEMAPNTEYRAIQQQCKRERVATHHVPHLIRVTRSFCERHPNCQLHDLADYLGVSNSTLKRRLKHESTTFQSIQDDTYRYLAICMVHDLGWSNQQVANHFEISDVNNFRRAFKRWTGVTPSQLKEA